MGCSKSFLQMIRKTKEPVFKTVSREDFFRDIKNFAREFKVHSAKSVHHGYIGGLFRAQFICSEDLRKLCKSVSTVKQRLDRNVCIMA